MVAGRLLLVVGLAVLLLAMPATAQLTSWYMAGANPQRTSYVAESVTGTLNARWYRPIEAYIGQQVNLIAGNNHIYVATARGLIVLNASDGSLAWRWDTQLPLGQAPTLDSVSGTYYVYVPGTDRKLHCLRDNGTSYTYMWGFDNGGATGGAFYTNPLIVNGRVYVGNRDGKMYAVWAQGQTSPGTLSWSFQTGGPIMYSPAYSSTTGAIYFASDDCYAYALNATTGAAYWPNGGKSAKLPSTSGFHSWWPTIWEGYVIYTLSPNYPGDVVIGRYCDMDWDDMLPSGGSVGPAGSEDWAGHWPNSTPTMDASLVNNHFQAKPWRRAYAFLDRTTGAEYTNVYCPFEPVLTENGGPGPFVVGADSVPYQMAMNNRSGGGGTIPQAQISGWKFGTVHISTLGSQNAQDEPIALSAGGNYIYHSLCCARQGNYVGYNGATGSGSMWQYSLWTEAPNFDVMWFGDEETPYPGLWGMYGGASGTYHDHGDQNPIVPYSGKLYVHRRNTVIAWDSVGGASSPLATLTINHSATSTTTARSLSSLKSKLEAEIDKIIDAGDLKPGIVDAGQAGMQGQNLKHGKMYHIPGETFYVLSAAYPHLNATLQGDLLDYLADQYTRRGPTSVSEYGWGPGVHRSQYYVPDDQASYAPMSSADTTTAGNLPPENIYGLWKYALISGDSVTKYNAIKNRLQNPCPLNDTNLIWGAWDLNRWIAGYYAYLQLEAMAGATKTQAIENELNRLRAIWVNSITKDSPFGGLPSTFPSGFTVKSRYWSQCRPFVWMTPELANYLRLNKLSTFQAMVPEYNWMNPYWFLVRYEGTQSENNIAVPFDRQMYLAKAWVLQDSAADLDKYLDVPLFEKGDLQYIQHLCALIEAIEGPVNYAPLAGGDRYDDHVQDTTLVKSAPGVLSNDLDPEGLPVSVVLPIVDQPDHGTLSISANGSFTYTPAAGYTGPDSFQYKCTDGVLQSNTVTVNITVIPPGAVWQHGDIGAVGATGTFVKNEGTFTIEGSGANITGNADEFHFVYRQMQGDGEVVARIVSIENTNNLAQAGVMMRQSLAADSAHAMTSINYYVNTGARWARRTSAGGTTTSTSLASIPWPYWVKVVRSGSTFTSWIAPDAQPLVWTQIGTYSTITMTDPIYVGLAVTSRNDGVLCTGVFDNVTAPYVGGGGGTPVVTVTAPDSAAGEPSNDGQFTVTRSGSTTGNLVVNVSKTGTATNGSDYASIGTTVTILDGQASVNVLVDVTNDGTVEGAETCILTATSGGGYTVGSPSNATVNIADDDTANQAPVASNDTYNNVVEDTTYVVNTPGVLGNDTDPDGNPITAIKVADPAHGTVTVNSNGSFTYTPAGNYNGADSFTYKANDGSLDSNTATVNLTIGAVNDAPTAGNDSGYSVNQNSYVTISAPGVLANDTDIDSGSITAANASNPPHGSVTLNTNGSFTYTPDAGYSGPDSFTYQAYDGALYSTAATVSITVNAGASSVDLSPSQDSYIINGLTNNYGTIVRTQCNAVAPPGNFRATLSQFAINTSNVPGTVTAVQIRLYTENSPTSTLPVNVYANTASWTETGVNGTNEPGEGTLIGTATSPTGTSPVLFTIDLNASGIALVEQWRTGAASNYGITIRGSSGSPTHYYHSREATTEANRPIFRITYQP